MFTASKDGNIKYWDINEKSEITQKYKVHSGEWCTDMISYKNLICSVGKDQAIRFWNFRDKETLECVYEQKDAHKFSINAVASESDYIYTAGNDNNINIWKCHL